MSKRSFVYYSGNGNGKANLYHGRAPYVSNIGFLLSTDNDSTAVLVHLFMIPMLMRRWSRPRHLYLARSELLDTILKHSLIYLAE